jgi:predicted nucleotidyltransferase
VNRPSKSKSKSKKSKKNPRYLSLLALKMSATTNEGDGAKQNASILKKRSSLSSDDVIRRLKLDKRSVEAIYLIGSRFWGTANERSDYDLIVILKTAPASQGKSKSKSRESKERVSVHHRDIDATLLSFDEFGRRLASGRFVETLLLYWPDEFCIVRPSDRLRKLVRPSEQLFLSAVVREAERDWRVAQKFCDKGNGARGRKTMAHCLRMMDLAVHEFVLRDGGYNNAAPAIDFWRGASLVNRIYNDFAYVNDFESLRAEFDPTRVDLLKALVQRGSSIKQ